MQTSGPRISPAAVNHRGKSSTAPAQLTPPAPSGCPITSAKRLASGRRHLKPAAGALCVISRSPQHSAWVHSGTQCVAPASSRLSSETFDAGFKEEGKKKKNLFASALSRLQSRPSSLLSLISITAIGILFTWASTTFVQSMCSPLHSLQMHRTSLCPTRPSRHECRRIKEASAISETCN